MKKFFTKTMALVTILLVSAWSVNAQTPAFTWDKSELTTGWSNGGPFTTLKIENNIRLQQLATTGTANSYFSLDNSNTAPALTGTTDAVTISLLASSSYISQIKISYSSNGTSVASPYVGYSTTITEMGSSTVTIDACDFDPAGVAGTTAVQKTYNAPLNTKFIILTRGKTCSGSTANTTTIRISRIEVYTVAMAPSISAFKVNDINATIDQSAKTITAQLPYGSSLTNITPEVILGGTATVYTPTGAQDFTNPVVYTAKDGTPANDANYTVTLTVNPTPSSDKDITNVTIGGRTPLFDAGTNTFSIVLPKASSLTQAVNFTKPSTASVNFTSGSSHDFSTPLSITVTAQDLTTKVYTLTAAVGTKNIAYVISTAVDAKDTKIRPMLASKYYLENILIANITTTYNFSNYDMVLLTEAPSSGSAGMKALWGINKPLLSLKMYAIQANTWNLSTASNPSPAATTVAVNEPNHPIFNGVTFSGIYNNEIGMFSAISSGNGVQTTPYTGNYNLANVKGALTTGILELPVGTTSPMTGTTAEALTSKLLFVSISNDNQNIVTDNALKIIDNSVNYLTGATTWGTDAGTRFQDITVSYTGSGTEEINFTSAKLKWNAVPATVKYIITKESPSGIRESMGAKAAIAIDVNGDLTSLELTGLSPKTNYTYSVVAQNAAGVNSKPANINFSTLDTRLSNYTLQNIAFDGRNILNPERQQLQVFDATGRLLIASREDINMSAQAKGVYLVKGDNGMMKIAVTK